MLLPDDIMTEWRALSDYRITDHNRRTGEQKRYDPTGEQPIYKKHNNRKEAENVAEVFYEDSLGYGVSNINHKFNRSLAQALEDVPRSIVSQLAAEITMHTEDPPANQDQLLDVIDEAGIPDLFVYSEEDDDFLFVEVKIESDSFTDTQQPWIAKFEYLPVNIARISRKFDPDEAPSESFSPESDLASQFQARKHEYETRPKTGSRSDNNGTASLVTLVHYGLLAATDYDTGVIRSLDQEVLAASSAAIRDQGKEAVYQYQNQPPSKGLNTALENEFSNKFGTEPDPTPVVIRGSIGGISGDICAMLDVLERADPLAATRRNLDGPV